MKKLDRKQTLLFFYMFDIALVLFLIATVLPASFFRKSKNDEENHFVLNPKYSDSVERIDIASGSTKIVMKRAGNVWTGTDSNSNYTISWPCDSSLINEFIKCASSKKEIHLKSEKSSALHSFGLDKSSRVQIDFYGKNKSNYSTVFFGNSDSLEKSIYFKYWNSNSVYSVNDEILFYAKCDPNFWCEPYIVPSSVCGGKKNDCEKFLRRGQLVYLTPPLSLEPINSIVKKFENGGNAEYKFYEKDNSVIVLSKFAPGKNMGDAESRAVSEFDYRFSISKVTYEKFLEKINAE